MNSTMKPKTTRHTVNFLVFVPVFLVVLYLIGLAINPAANFGFQLAYVGRVLIQFLIFAVLAAALIFMFYALVLHKPLGQVVTDLKRFEHPDGVENLSSAFLMLGMLMIAAQIVGWPTAVSLKLYLYEMLTKGTIGLLLATAITVLGAFVLGLNSVEHFVQYLEDANNNQVVLVLMGLVNLAIFIAMR